MKQNCYPIINRILGSEGAYVDNKHDPGGATNMGITLATLTSWRHRTVSKQDVRNLPRSEAIAIDKARYWDAVCGDLLPAGVDYEVADAAVNSGPVRAIQWLQKALHVPVTGHMDITTKDALTKVKDPVALVKAYGAARLSFLERLTTFKVFGRGWSSRVAQVNKISIVMATAVHPANDNPAAARSAA